jgi:hypothetical protein
VKGVTKTSTYEVDVRVGRRRNRVIICISNTHSKPEVKKGGILMCCYHLSHPWLFLACHQLELIIKDKVFLYCASKHTILFAQLNESDYEKTARFMSLYLFIGKKIY